MKKNNLKVAFLGTPDISVYFLDKLKNLGFDFDIFITNPDAFVGRKKILTPSRVADWVKKNYDNKKIFKPEKIDTDFIENIKKEEIDLFFVLAYGKILPKPLLDIPKYGVVNLHPSLLPLYRGPSPIMSAILDDQKTTGYSLMLLDEKMDHGPILSQETVNITEWEKNNIMEKKFAKLGAEKFFNILNDFVNGKIKPKIQDHKKATFCKKYQKSDMELKTPLNTKENSRTNFLKYCAFEKPFFFFNSKDKSGNNIKKRAVVTLATFENNKFIIKKIIPEGKKEQIYNEKNFF